MANHADKKLKVQLVRGLNKRLEAHKACAMGLGLRRLHQTVIVQDTPSIRGMVNKISYLLKVETV